MNYRSFLSGLMLLASFFLVACSSLENRINSTDSGFGGTGIQQASTGDPSSGFGGTGIIGIISDFGSVWVNGVEVDYPDDLVLESNLYVQDQLKLGQVVILETDTQLNDKQHPTTQKIRIHYSLAGEIQQVNKNAIKVNDQWVNYAADTPMDAGLSLEVGTYVAINAIQKNAQQWEASRLNINPMHVAIDRPAISIDFSSNTHRLLADDRLSLMIDRWSIKGLAKLSRQQWNRSNHLKRKSRFPLKYQQIRKRRMERIRMQREQMGASDRIRANRDAMIPNNMPNRSRPNMSMPGGP